MSFGYSVGDFVTIGQLCWSVYRACKVAAGEYEEISRELGTLHVSFRNLEEEAANPMSILNRRGVGRKADMDTILSNIRPVLEDLERMVSKYSSLGKSEKRKWDRLRFGAEDLENIRGKLTFHTSVIDLFMNNLSAGSLAKIETALEELIFEIRAGRRAKTVLSVQDEDTESATAWKELETDLLDSGITKKDIEKHKDAIRSYIKTLMVEEAEGSSLSARCSRSSSIVNFAEAGQGLTENENWESISQRRSLENDIEQGILSTTIAASPLAGADTSEIQDATIPEIPTKIGDLPAAKDSRTVAPSLTASISSDRPLLQHYLLNQISTPKEKVVPGSADAPSYIITTKHSLRPFPELSAIEKPTVLTSLTQNPLLTYFRSGSEESRHLDIVEQILHKGTGDRAKDHGGHTALRVTANNGHKALIELPPKESDGDATEGSPGHLVRYDTSDKDHDQNEHTTKARIGDEDEDDIATILPLPSNTLQVPNLNGFSEGAGQRSRTLTQSHAVQSDIAQGKIATQLLLQNRFDVNQKEFDKEEALLWAALKGHNALVQLVLEKGANIEAKDEYGQTALHRAACNGHNAVVQFLLEKRAETEAKEKVKEVTALHFAASRGHNAVVQLLLEKGANIEAKDKYGWTALHRAALKGHNAVVQLLLEKRAEIEAKTNKGLTALHFAASGGHNVVVQLLLENGANIKAKTNEGGLVLDCAARNGHNTTVKLLKQTKPSVYQRLKLSLRQSQG